MSVKIIAELSMNHLGDYSLVKKMVKSAAESGADYVKFQTWQVSNLSPGAWDEDGRREDYIKSEMTAERHELFSKYCDDAGIKFLTSCFAPCDLDMIRRYSNEVKIPGPECKRCDLVIPASKMFDTVFLSTGACTFEELAQHANLPNVYIMHCVSAYPCPIANVNFPRMLAIKSLTERYGYSGHMLGIWDAIAAISLGAKVVEKHFTTDKSMSFKDNIFSIEPHELKQIREYADTFDEMVVDRGCDYQDIEDEVRSVYARRWDKDK
jgi:N,N'-diacetyllegionaminate synthase